MENYKLEYKRQITDELEKELVAFLNSKSGGVIYIGIDNDGSVIGVSKADEIQLKLKDRLKNNILPSIMGLFEIVSEVIDNREVIKIIIASGSEKPYYIRRYGMSERGCYIRLGSASEPMQSKQIEHLFASRIRNSLGNIPSPRQDLSFEQLKIYYEAVGKPLNKNFAKNLELLTDNGTYNYVAYLMSDNNTISMKVAKYMGVDRVELIENNEYGYCSIIKATKQILDKIDLENITLATITSKERVEQRKWFPIPIREAIINAIVHNDYTREVSPKIELFDDRIEMTSCGTLPDGLTENDFFEGTSMPRNKELMRIFKDLDLVEQLGSGIPRILRYYKKEHFRFLDNFIRMVFPIQKIGTKSAPSQTLSGIDLTKKIVQLSTKSAPSQQEIDKISNFCIEAKLLVEIMSLLNWSDKTKFRNKYIKPLIEAGILTMTIPDKPRSRFQRYQTLILKNDSINTSP